MSLPPTPDQLTRAEAVAARNQLIGGSKMSATQSKPRERFTATVTGIVDVGHQRPFDSSKPTQPTWAVIFTTSDGDVLARKYAKSQHSMSAIVALGQAVDVDLEHDAIQALLGTQVAIVVESADTAFAKVVETSRLEAFDALMDPIPLERCKCVGDVSVAIAAAGAKAWVMSLPQEVRRLIGSRVVLRGGDHA